MDRSKLCSQIKVAEKITETPDAVTLRLDIPDSLRGKFQYSAGQFVTLFLDELEPEFRRSYSLSSCPDSDSHFSLTVKKIPGGKASTFLVDKIKPGDVLWLTPPAGNFKLPPGHESKTCVFLAAGSGITPLFSMLKKRLKIVQTKNHLLYQNQSPKTAIFRSELMALLETHPQTMTVLEAFSKSGHDKISTQPTGAHKVTQGHFGAKEISQTIQNENPKNCLFFLCGPEGFMKSMVSSLFELGVSTSQIFQESFLSTPSTPSAKLSTESKSPGAVTTKSTSDIHSEMEGAVVIGDKSTIDSPQEILVVMNGETTTVPYTDTKRSILDVLIDADVNPPYSCMDGACMACLAKVTSGAVFQKELGILTDDNVEQNETLTCQARACSRTTTINFDP
jgi:ferredoxin-NADP reductase/ferredoxin